MLHIIWLVLKIIGMILLALFALLLAVLAAVLLAPVRYRVKGSYHGSPVVTGKVTWLLHILSIKAVYDGELDLGVRVFGIRLLKPGSRKEKEVEEELILQSQELMHELEEELEHDVEDDVEEEPLPHPEEKKAERQNDVKKEKKAGRASSSDSKPGEDSTSNPGGDSTSKPGEEKSVFVRRWEKLKASLTGSYYRIKEKVLDLKENLEKGKEFLQNEENKKTIKLLWKSGKKLLKHVLPRKVKGRVEFGFDDPYITGQILSAAGVFYPVYARQLEICPMFDQSVFEAEGELKGRIRIGTVLFILLRVYCNKNFRVLLKQRRG
ncbi:hypothetical protein GPL15_24150 [Clostridium sp. MCC353]|uniref:DUF2953 domain-containing protein n=1 Tax=Clostridium sp. MCC353 TaxID=2592646 RepID=UPI001C020517|nr:DUF2953 domain-containing protein [Clostridium sp. MCC353]MBT9779575.1 hypothetical protein [Clostridium sp. MCC353]